MSTTKRTLFFEQNLFRFVCAQFCKLSQFKKGQKHETHIFLLNAYYFSLDNRLQQLEAFKQKKMYVCIQQYINLFFIFAAKNT